MNNYYSHIFSHIFRHLFAFSLVVCSSMVFSATPILGVPPISIKARSYILYDYYSGKIIVGNNYNAEIPPASLTKLMTSFIVAEQVNAGNLKLTDTATVSKKAYKAPGSRMFLEFNSKVSIDELLNGLVIQSGNDAGTTLAEHIAGSELSFARIMNTEAEAIGMTHSSFMNATGLPEEEHYSTAYDMALLTKEIISRHPRHYHRYAKKSFTYNNIRQLNRNKLLWRDDRVDGLKTGHTQEAGYSLVASAVDKSLRLIAVVMGAKSALGRTNEVQRLLQFGFNYYEMRDIFPAGQNLATATIWFGEKDQINVISATPIKVLVPKGHTSPLNAVMNIDTIIKAPILAGETVGSVDITYEGEVLETFELIAETTIVEATTFKKMWHGIVLYFNDLMSKFNTIFLS